ncbi:hypothetical protein H2204_014604 [Knufia peltigerae]|uniref:(S)-ureidoglycine aminohydrolase cupin domain-containing protein n=1 Tax=Knufia peltigerae TaxID=1002370 RepID=A0AA39CN10_9EURO|nr:hypothetical protein H2204_014604 [Knufia peltigerae]
MIQRGPEPPRPHVEPKLGKQVHGEVTIARTFGSTGDLSSGFWRIGPTSPGAQADGSHKLTYSAPLGDETACVVDGTAVLTVTSTAKTYKLPKGLEVRWEIDAPFFKKYRVTWNGTDATPEPPVDLQINHVAQGRPSGSWGALQDFIRMGGSTGTHLSGGWRSGKGIAATNLDDKGSLTTPYTGTLGDEMILLLEGEVDVTETETGNKHSFRAGDAIGLTSGMHITWISKGPYTKKLWVITRDKIPEA